jgi:hypothetical protein
VGLLAALPIYYLSMASAYEEITGDWIPPATPQW